MQITPEQILNEAGAMALELRLKDQVIAALQAENAQLRGQLAAHEGTVEDETPSADSGGHR
jgi:hypothetical protein